MEDQIKTQSELPEATGTAEVIEAIETNEAAEATEKTEAGEATKEFLKIQANYYQRYAEKGSGDEREALVTLLHFLESQRVLLSRIQLPWSQCNSIVHQGSMLCFDGQLGKNARKKLIINSTKIINNFTYLAQNTKRIEYLLNYYTSQIKNLREMLGEPVEIVEEELL